MDNETTMSREEMWLQLKERTSRIFDLETHIERLRRLKDERISDLEGERDAAKAITQDRIKAFFSDLTQELSDTKALLTYAHKQNKDSSDCMFHWQEESAKDKEALNVANAALEKIVGPYRDRASRLTILYVLDDHGYSETAHNTVRQIVAQLVREDPTGANEKPSEKVERSVCHGMIHHCAGELLKCDTAIGMLKYKLEPQERPNGYTDTVSVTIPVEART